HVAGTQQAVVELLRSVVLVVARGYPRPTDLDLADALAVPGKHRAGVVGDSYLDAGDDAAGSLAPLDLFLRRRPLRRARDGRKRSRFGHPPALVDIDAELLLETLDQRRSHGRSP